MPVPVAGVVVPVPPVLPVLPVLPVVPVFAVLPPVLALGSALPPEGDVEVGTSSPAGTEESLGGVSVAVPPSEGTALGTSTPV